MANEFRSPRDFTFGQLSASAAISDTTLSSTQFTGLGTTYTASVYLPVVLMDSTIPAYEVVWVTAHSASSSTVTVVRGKEGTSARAWPSGTQWAAAPTQRDGLLAVTSGTVPSDLHTGQRLVETDTNLIKTHTYLSGNVAGAGVCLPYESGARFNNTSVPSNATIVKRIGCVIGATPNVSGIVTVTFPSPFPNGVIGALAGSIATSAFVGAIACQNFTTTAMDTLPVQYNGVAPGLVSFYYEATGY